MCRKALTAPAQRISSGVISAHDALRNQSMSVEIEKEQDSIAMYHTRKRSMSPVMIGYPSPVFRIGNR
jgi:hypothetical protein